MESKPTIRQPSVILALGLEQTQQIASHLISAEFVPWKSEADVIAVMELANSLNISFGTALVGIVPIKGKPTLSASLQRALAHRAGCKLEIIDYYTPVAHFITEFGIPLILKQEDLESGKYHVVPPDGTRKENVINIAKIPTPFIPEAYVKGGYSDRVTTVKITRGVESFVVSYYLHEAFRAGYFAPGKEKDNWLAHPGAMCFARCSSRAINIAASDATNGLPTTEELADTYDVPYVEISSTTAKINDEFGVVEDNG